VKESSYALPIIIDDVTVSQVTDQKNERGKRKEGAWSLGPFELRTFGKPENLLTYPPVYPVFNLDQGFTVPYIHREPYTPFVGIYFLEFFSLSFVLKNQKRCSVKFKN
jgi:hypothetical protein